MARHAPRLHHKYETRLERITSKNAQAYFMASSMTKENKFYNIDISLKKLSRTAGKGSFAHPILNNPISRKMRFQILILAGNNRRQL